MKKKMRRWIQHPVVLLLSLIGVALFVLGIRIVSQKDRFVTVEIISSGGEWWETLPKTPYWLAGSVKPGDIEYAIGGKKLAEVLETKKYEEDASKILWAKIRLLVTKDRVSGGYKFNYQPLLIGSTLKIRPHNIQLTGNVISIEGIGRTDEFKTVRVTVKSYDLYPWFADAIHVGDTAVDDEGNITAAVLAKTTEPAEMTTGDSMGRILPNRNPLKRDVTLTVDIQVAKRGGQLYFNLIQPVLIGTKLWIPFPTFELKEASVVAIGSSDGE